VNDREFGKRLVPCAGNASAKRPKLQTRRSRNLPLLRSPKRQKRSAPPRRCISLSKNSEESKWTSDDGWPKVWAEMSDEELRDRLRHYLFLAANSPLQHAKRMAQPVAEATCVGGGNG